jgi:putative transposase
VLHYGDIVNENIIVANYKRFLPHIQLVDCVLFVTWRLAFSLPKPIIEELRIRKEKFNAELSNLTEQTKGILIYNFQKQQMDYWDNAISLDKSLPDLLYNDNIMQELGEIIKSYDKIKYELFCYCIMPNHVHLLIKPLKQTHGEYYTLSNIMHSIKSLSSNRINKLLDRKGRFWQVENYDHVVRNETEFQNIIRYIAYNSVKAGLCEKPEKWRGTYLSETICSIEDVR